MLYIPQTIFEPPHGNCLSACVASLFDLQLDDVPNFTALSDYYRDENGQWLERQPNAWWDGIKKFAAERGLVVLLASMPPKDAWTLGHDYTSGILAIATFKSPRGDWNHCAVAEINTGRIVWDPHPNATPGAFLDDSTLVDVIIFFKPQHTSVSHGTK